MYSIFLFFFIFTHDGIILQYDIRCRLHNIQKYFLLVISTLHLTEKRCECKWIQLRTIMQCQNLIPIEISCRYNVSLARTQMDHEAKHVER